MPEIPAFCDNCGTVFGSGFVVENSRDITFSGNVVGPCPNCGSMGTVPDGVYNIIGGTIELLSGPKKSIDQIKRLASLLREAQQTKMSKADLGKRLEEETPDFSTLSKWIPDTPSARYALISLILFFLFGLADQGWKYLEYKDLSEKKDELSNTAIEQVINKSDEEIEEAVQLILAAPDSIESSKNVDQDSSSYK